MAKRRALAVQLDLLALSAAAPEPPAPGAPQLVVLPPTPPAPRPWSDPGPECPTKMAGKSLRKLTSTRAYHRVARPVEPASSATANPRDVTESGPNRYFLRELGDSRHQVVDRETGNVQEEGPWLNCWGLALRLNGIEVATPVEVRQEEWRYFEMMDLREARAHAAAGGIAVHYTGFPFRRWRFTAHLFAEDRATLEQAIRRVGADPKWIQYPDTKDEHFDLMGAPLAAAMRLCGRAGYDPTVEREVAHA